MAVTSATLIQESPPGLRYQPEFFTEGEEASLLEHIERLEFGEVKMHGVVAKRRVVHFGWNYGYESWKIEPTEPIIAAAIPTFILRACDGS